MEMTLNFTLEIVLNLLNHFASHKLTSFLGYFYQSTRTVVPNIKILHKSANFLVVNKPHDLVINSDDPKRDSLYKCLAHNYPQLASKKYKFGFRVLHRLDYATSGLMVIPLTDPAMSSASKAFQKRQTQKFYIAILRGHVSENHIKIHFPIGDTSDPQWQSIKMVTASDPLCTHPRESETHLVVVSRGILGGYPATEVLVKLVTGRRHQIRVHCHQIGHTLAGDYTYSNRHDQFTSRMFLHAHRIIIPNRVEPLDITSPYNLFELDELDEETVLNRYQPVEVIYNINDKSTFDLFTCPLVKWFLIF
ncbi:hypothetical protein TCAL_05542 [Tigriopus californicus]|uniref:Pseudouridine synthase RsuA/RluA-like domain-containing protein n=2 Tax=Tigriopus californicus TaxID=6832 RepID=A0A553P6R2_TIGCA|nr:hypothetical protein TCAL_05542 [Tigriopus californicus]